MTALCFLPLLAAVLLLWRGRCRQKRLLLRLDGMIDAAARGDFSGAAFDESLVSSLESRLADVLNASGTLAEKLRQEQDGIKTLVADLSHQTKTPVSNILLYTQLLEEEPLSPKGRQCVGALDSQARKLGDLMEALVKVSRLEAGILAFHPKPGPVAPLMAQAAAQYAPAAREKGIALSVEPAGAAAVFDPKWTGEALCNLVDNAVKYTPAGGRVQIRAVNYELFCRIDVSDTGPGIPEEEQAKIFGRFYRAPSAYESPGVGIGLFLTRQIVSGQGGYVKVSSAPGRGSVFSLFLPKA